MKKTFFDFALCLAALAVFHSPDQAQETATFEDLGLQSASWWNGSDTNGINEFRSGDFRFVNNYNKEWASWSGFAYSNLNDNLYVDSMGYDNSYKSAFGGGARGSETYAVAYASSFDPAKIKSPDSVNGQVLSGAYFTNSVISIEKAVHGDDFGVTPFKTGDFIKVSCIGRIGNDSVSQLDFYLADYRNNDTNEHYLLRTWEWVDLSSLGPVTSVEFLVSSNQIGSFGDNFPQYFCLDNYFCTPGFDTISLEIRTAKTASASFGFDDIFGLEGNGKYAIEILQEPQEDVASIRVGENALTVEYLKDNVPTCCRIKASRNGQSRYVFANIGAYVQNEDTGRNPEITLYPVPAREILHIRTGFSNYAVEIFNAAGQCLKRIHGLDGNTCIHVGDLEPGIYIIRTAQGRHSLTNRFVINR